MKLHRLFLILTILIGLNLNLAEGADYALPSRTPGDRMLVEAFRAETARLAERSLAGIRSLGIGTRAAKPIAG